MSKLKNLAARMLGSVSLAASLAIALTAVPTQAQAGSWFWWWSYQKPSWWTGTTTVSTPEIDAGLARNALAILAGGLIVLRSRKKHQG